MHTEPHTIWLPRAEHIRRAIAVTVSLLLTPLISTAEQQPTESILQSGVRTIVVSGRVGHVHGSRVFALEDPSGTHANRIVVVPNINALPAVGSVVVVGGVLRPIEQAGVPADERGDAAFTEETVVIAARSVVVEDGRDLIQGGGFSVGPPLASLVPPDRRPVPVAASLAAQPGRVIASSGSAETKIRPATLANVIDEIAGQDVRVTSARVVGVISPQVFLIEPASSYQMALGDRDRIAVLLAGNNALRVDAPTLVGSHVSVAGVARTPLGLRVSREVPWPRELTDDYMYRLEVRAAVLASSVQSPEGVELTQAR
jgi:hypothetical protein